MAERSAVEENYRPEILHSTELPAEIKDWDKEHVRNWILGLTDVDNENAEILYKQDINGKSLLLLEKADLKDIGIKTGPALLIIHKRDELKAHQLNSSGSQLGISLMMLWPETDSKLSAEDFSDSLRTYVSLMRSSFTKEMKPVCNGMRAVIHFYLGKRTGYDRLITQMDIDTCVDSQQTMSGKLRNGKIWKNEKVQNMLHRVTGRILKDVIMTDASNPNMQVEVSPLFKSQLCGDLGDRVSFFVGFSMNGPVALGIQPEP
ncbi:sterile alpha motif domain-containing protein 9-like isoform X2 [Neoarius graeffei]|uniref:sterile alpha motif domain-containing protein 9-like isoform X2 n=1 Tax=Neoarius graeffei TaxID=443677 RepID=UPI00298CCCBB|nr:sterile alpha motif domain-containing protein 9-like isoform X2 [Neoarius graeffei]